VSSEFAMFENLEAGSLHRETALTERFGRARRDLDEPKTKSIKDRLLHHKWNWV